MSQLKEQLTEFLTSLQDEGKTLSVEWNGGGDEAIVSFKVNQEEIEFDAYSWQRDLTDHLILVMEIPSAGDGFLMGDGYLTMGPNGTIGLNYSAEYSNYAQTDLESMFLSLGIDLKLSRIIFDEGLQAWTRRHLLHYLSKVKGEFRATQKWASMKLWKLGYVPDLDLQDFEESLSRFLHTQFLTRLKPGQYLSIEFDAYLSKDKLEFLAIGPSDIPSTQEWNNQKTILFE